MTDTASWRSQYPYESRYLDIDGLRLHYVDEGEGSPVLMVHGNPTWSFYWRSLVNRFKDGHRMVAPDHIGCGLSDKPSAKQYEFTLARRIDDLKQLITSLDLNDITLVAHDWGGAIGLGAAVDMPERFSRFLLLNTGAFTGEACPHRIRVCRTPLLGRLGLQGLNLFARAALKMTTSRGPLSKEAADGLIAPYDNWAHRLAVCEFVRDIPLATSHRSYATLKSIEDRLPTLADRPISIVWGMQDWCFTPKFLERFIEYFPNADVTRLDDVGHYVMEDAPKEVAETLKKLL